MTARRYSGRDLAGAFLAGLALGVALFLLAVQPAAAAVPMANRSPLLAARVSVPLIVDRLSTPTPTRATLLGFASEPKSERRPARSGAHGDVAGTRRSLGLSGTATWYCCTAGYSVSAVVAAAGPRLRVGDWRGRTVTVCAGRCARVRLVDWCQCYRGTSHERLIDLQIGAVRTLGLDPSRGVYRVTVG